MLLRTMKLIEKVDSCRVDALSVWHVHH